MIYRRPTLSINILVNRQQTILTSQFAMNLRWCLISLLVLFVVGDIDREMGKDRNRLNGKHLRVSVGHIPPTSSFIRNSTGHIIGFSGIAYEIFDLMARRLHFTYTLVPVYENAGYYINGTWTGNLGQLARKEFDASLGPYAPTLERYGAIDFVGYIGSSTTCMLMKYPQVKISDSAIFDPYSSTLWALWICSMIFVGIAALLLVHFQSERSTDKVKRFGRIDGMFMYLLGTMLNQGGYYRSGHRSIGFIAGIWCFIGFCFINIYNSILTSRLSAHYQYPEVKSLDDLANKPQYQLATFKGSVWESNLMSATAGTNRILGDRYRKCKTCSATSIPQLGSMPLQGDIISFLAYAFAASALERDYEMKKMCRMTIVNVNYAALYSFFGIPRDSPFLEEFHRESLWAKAIGIDKINNNWPEPNFRFPEQCFLKYNSKGVAVQQFNVPIKLRQLLPAFILLGVGYLCSCLLFLSELLVAWMKKLKKSNIN